MKISVAATENTGEKFETGVSRWLQYRATTEHRHDAFPDWVSDVLRCCGGGQKQTCVTLKTVYPRQVSVRERRPDRDPTALSFLFPRSSKGVGLETRCGI